jgi:hypothetical protein
VEEEFFRKKHIKIRIKWKRIKKSEISSSTILMEDLSSGRNSLSYFHSLFVYHFISFFFSNVVSKHHHIILELIRRSFFSGRAMFRSIPEEKLIIKHSLRLFY